ncbi:MAG: DUF4974 domain-containing protein [Candidatus Pseudobacter hemicellulosilyticus]|uniref:DUF4974 domain-containing protein n=1 Tax=Candidatus Pseudobacter hemicellulosilyticus TaxID=3121375 RepID=A0AAJ5WWD5_9BACT|nr:MAG: DUF4974 domain-containing protein [Pseudobacter sp.]
MAPSNLPELLQKLLDNTLQPEELQALRQWLADPAHDTAVEDFIEKIYYQHRYQEAPAASIEALQRLLIAQLQQTPNAGLKATGSDPLKQAAETETAIVTPIGRNRRRQWLAAAAITIGIGLTAYFWLATPTEAPATAANNTTPTTPPKPGTDGAILTLADGRQLTLDSLGNGALTTENGMQVVLENQQLSYRATHTEAPEAITYNTLTTPRGRQFRMVLPDGTRVWLNSASSLVYPTRFTGTERKVTITGEAYFEVAKQPQQPFRVVAYDHTTEVLGTDLNINAYTDEPYTRTTLIDGRIRVLPLGADSKPVNLQPGQQVLLANGNPSQTRVVTADTEEVVAWKNGYFQFSEIDIQALMRQVARWYDVSIRYEGNLDQLHFSGIVSRRQEMAQLLKILEASHQIRFRQEGQTLIVYPK